MALWCDASLASILVAWLTGGLIALSRRPPAVDEAAFVGDCMAGGVECGRSGASGADSRCSACCCSTAWSVAAPVEDDIPRAGHCELRPHCEQEEIDATATLHKGRRRAGMPAPCGALERAAAQSTFDCSEWLKIVSAADVL